MVSVKFPSMFSTTSTNLEKDSHKATYQNILLVLGSEKGEFISDPYFGVRIRSFMFDQNNHILKDIIIDEIYTQLKTFVPQIMVNRNDITINIERAKMTCNIKCVNRADFTLDTYNVVLLNGEGE